jgi:hypothetical protein
VKYVVSLSGLVCALQATHENGSPANVIQSKTYSPLLFYLVLTRKSIAFDSLKLAFAPGQLPKV